LKKYATVVVDDKNGEDNDNNGKEDNGDDNDDNAGKGDADWEDIDDAGYSGKQRGCSDQGWGATSKSRMTWRSWTRTQ